MTSNKLVSIIVPVYNQEKLVIRALDSIPRREDIEVICYDDGSSDNTRKVLLEYKRNHPELDIIVRYGRINRGLAYAKNRLIEKVSGKYFQELDSDDYLLTEEYNKLLDSIDKDYDIICLNSINNEGNVLPMTTYTLEGLCAQWLRLIRTDFVTGLSFNEDLKAAEDWFYNLEMLKRNPSIKFTGIVAHHYNFPREGSLFDKMVKGEL